MVARAASLLTGSALDYRRPPNTTFVYAGATDFTAVHIFNETRKVRLTMCNRPVCITTVDLNLPVCKECDYRLKRVKP